ncbi:16S rRNA (guanine(966)-N(2))-methyltransferase RsmD [Mucilaginibacter sp. OK283]|jgi:16S rRNA (guanine(966)-N(2))-methyltransferase RsmD|uniref:16S rRNA (guanine(966)-N(2))-methyltransferase RsmD n=1 Tax=Mucilaginibacter sp. OK283 TaxID=1881049 RepID=UPI0008C89555|nr:16S rRNA (guanine(966)-N(2))-methyltransferase RsmD [Mucilaginibacter sp. OK283]SEO80820.1 16S rRNA (guanine(966)-N(2))-methyltransferase RsmD [Mucilaginibacter sp. OK283]
MRIIGGTLRGLRLNPPKNLPVRPTTDLAKEALFNILLNQIEFEGIKVLDLFSGTGNISLEFASRGAAEVISVDRSIHCVNYLKDTSRQHKLDQVKVYKEDVFKYLQMETEQYDLVFADPPYDLNKIPEIPKIVFERNILLPGALLIVEHQSMQNISQHPAFVEQRKYGHSSFSFFRNQADEQA